MKMMRCMGELTRCIEKKIAMMLPEKFAVAFNAWSCMQTRFVNVFAIFPAGSLLDIRSAFWGFPYLRTRTCWMSSHTKSFLELVLSVFSKSIDKVILLAGDNCPTNKAFADLFPRLLLECHSHRFNLAVQNLTKEVEEEVESVFRIMAKLRNLISAARLQKVTNLRPPLMNSTRRSLCHMMLQRYIELKPFFLRSLISWKLQISC